VSYLLYSRLLTPDLFGLYAIAAAVGALGVTVLDGGMKNTVIKAPRELTPAENGTLAFVMTAGAVALTGLLAAAAGPVARWFPAAGRDYRFLALFGALYLVSWPFMALPTARLERRLQYRRVAWIESVGLLLERGLPVVLLLATRQGIYSFAWGLAAGRLFRVASLNARRPQPIRMPSASDLASVMPLVAEGAWLQLSTACCMVRDNLHVLLVGPLFGKAWVGRYAWDLQLCVMVSQVFVQMSARVSLPLFAAGATAEERWRACLYQVRLLAVAIGPALVTLLAVTPSVDARFFGGRWAAAIGLLPLLFVRMVSSLGATPLGPLVMVERGSKAYAQANLAWTAAEVGVAAAALALIGPAGLAWAYALVGWLGLWLYLGRPGRNQGAPPDRRLSALLSPLLLRPGLAVSLAALAGLAAPARTLLVVRRDVGRLSALAAAALLASYLCERDVRSAVARLLATVPRGARRPGEPPSR
jgi:O-antigen/teichoic acid export membrane protein